MAHMSGITDRNPYVVVSWKPEAGRAPVRGRGLFIPREFEAAIVTSNLHVVLKLEAADALRDIFEMAGSEPPEMDGPVIVKRVDVRTDRFSFVSPADFGRIPLKRWTALAVAAAAGTRAELMQEGYEGATVDEWRSKRVDFSDLAPRPVGRPRMEDGFNWRGQYIDLSEVLEVAEAGAPRHIKAIQDHFGDPGDPMPRRTAQNWYERALAQSNASPNASSSSSSTSNPDS